MYRCYPSEPVLATAAQGLVSRNLIDYFEKLRNHLLCRGFDRGDLAETIAAELCIQAVSKAKGIGENENESKTCKDLDAISFINARKFILEDQIDTKAFESKIKMFPVEN
jgi:hypothetical protein